MKTKLMLVLLTMAMWTAWPQTMEQQKTDVIQFSIEAANQHVANMKVPVALNINHGQPSYLAILVDDTNFNDAVWNAYASPNQTVNLGTNEGWHGVWIGLRGYADEAKDATWEWRRFKLESNPPQIVVTNPATGLVDQPVIQLQGYSSKDLSHISYDLSNAAGTETNQQVLVTDRDYSKDTAEFTTNYFQAYDVPLTNGLNVITLHATDDAGNVATTNFSFTLDYSSKTNPPVVQLLWPLDGMEICGNDIVCRGHVSDETVTVNVQLLDAKGTTNTVGSLVGRDGNFYANNLTLADGTNYLTYVATDVAGNVTTTNIIVSTSNLGLTMDPVAAGQTVVTGTISDSSYTVYVNGVKAANDGTGRWSAIIVPIGILGGAVTVNAFK